jgi:thymidylate synthase ThyX
MSIGLTPKAGRKGVFEMRYLSRSIQNFTTRHRFETYSSIDERYLPPASATMRLQKDQTINRDIRGYMRLCSIARH